MLQRADACHLAVGENSHTVEMTEFLTRPQFGDEREEIQAEIEPLNKKKQYNTITKRTLGKDYS